MSLIMVRIGAKATGEKVIDVRAGSVAAASDARARIGVPDWTVVAGQADAAVNRDARRRKAK